MESVYQAALNYELQKRGLGVVQQLGLPVQYEGVKLDLGFRVDLIVGEKVVIEIKSVEALSKAHMKQLQTYLRLTKQPVGLLINFAGATLKEGLRRVVNDHVPSASPRLRVNQIQPEGR